jgi:uncharacterized HAD superfamily protein/hypoxanthine phosphoribosyltransferase
MTLQYRNVRDMNKCIVDNLHKVPHDVDLIVGVPRSGMLPAMMISLYLDLPVTDVQGLIEGRIMKGGDRMRHVPESTRRKALLVDDSIYTGLQFKQTREEVSQATLDYEVLYCCIYTRSDRVDELDVYFEVLPGDDWLFEWNKLNHGKVPTMCVDMDGVLCRDPTVEEDDDGDKYRRFLETAEPLFRPRRPLGWIVTSRLEKYRSLTETWLSRHGITYSELRMMDLPTLQDRTPWLAIKHKAKAYSETASSLFVESSLGQAEQICRLSGRPVLCTQNSELIEPTQWQAKVGRAKRVGSRLVRKVLGRG